MTEEITPETLPVEYRNRLAEISQKKNEPVETTFKRFKDFFCYDKSCVAITNPEKISNRYDIALTRTTEFFVEDEETQKNHIGNEIRMADTFRKNTSLKEVHTVFKKRLFLSDTYAIDILLAVYLSIQKAGTPLWIFLIASSGDTKTELMRSLLGLKNIIVISDLTVKYFVSGAVSANDLLARLQENKNSLIVILDLANLTSKSKNEKDEIWAKFRDLYDGILVRGTGIGSRECLNAHAAMIAGGTKGFRSQYIIANQLGTRELLYTPKVRKDMLQKLNQAMENDDYETEMRRELSDIVKRFMTSHKLKEFKPTEEWKVFYRKQAQLLRILRATASIDRGSSSVMSEPDIETPTRLVKQFKRLTQALKSLDDDYPDEDIKEIIKRIVLSSGNQLRVEILKHFNNHPEEQTLITVTNAVEASKKTVAIELEILSQVPDSGIKKMIREDSINQKIDKETGEFYGGYLKERNYYWRDSP